MTTFTKVLLMVTARSIMRILGEITAIMTLDMMVLNMTVNIDVRRILA